MENARELMLLVDVVSKEKDVPKSDILSFLAEGMEVALRKNFPEGASIQIQIDEETGIIEGWRLYQLVDQIENVEAQMLFNEVEDEEVFDGYVWEKFDPKLNRQQFNITKQVALQKIKNLSREQQINEMLSKNINLYTGTVKVVRKDSIIIDYNGLDFTINRKNLLPRENPKPSDRIKFTLNQDDKGLYFANRNSEKFLIELLKDEISLIEEGVIEVVACARNAGFRSKIIVKSRDSRYDAARVTIGGKGIHVKNIQQEIPGEYLDVILYSEEPTELLIKAISPVNISNIIVDEDAKTMEISVDEKDISLAIGRNGKNIAMISSLIGWNIKVFSTDEWKSNQENESASLVKYFSYALDCDEELSTYIVEAGFTSIDEIAYVSEDDLELDELDEDTISALKVNAKETLADKEKLKIANSYKDLLSVGFSFEEIEQLNENSVFSLFDVSELSSYDLQDIIPAIDLEKAKAIIMKSRKS